MDKSKHWIQIYQKWVDIESQEKHEEKKKEEKGQKEKEKSTKLLEQGLFEHQGRLTQMFPSSWKDFSSNSVQSGNNSEKIQCTTETEVIKVSDEKNDDENDNTFLSKSFDENKSPENKKKQQNTVSENDSSDEEFEVTAFDFGLDF